MQRYFINVIFMVYGFDATATSKRWEGDTLSKDALSKPTLSKDTLSKRHFVKRDTLSKIHIGKRTDWQMVVLSNGNNSGTKLVTQTKKNIIRSCAGRSILISVRNRQMVGWSVGSAV